MQRARSIAAALLVTGCALPTLCLANTGVVQRGQEVFKLCEGCHSVVPGEHRFGPSLAGVIGRPAGRLKGYNFSDELKSAKFKWDAKSLGQWVSDEPKNMVPGTKMEFPGITVAADVQALVAYLSSVKAR